MNGFISGSFWHQHQSPYSDTKNTYHAEVLTCRQRKERRLPKAASRGLGRTPARHLGRAARNSAGPFTRSTTLYRRECFGLAMSGTVDATCSDTLTGRGAYRQEPRFTALETNASILEVGTARIFIDPHLVGPLVFFDPRFFAQYKTKLHISDTRQVSEMRKRIREQFGPISLVVLSQALADHAHEPSLRYLDRELPVVAPNSARPLLTKLGFENVQYLRPGNSFRMDCGSERSTSDEYVDIQAVKGSVVGPPWQEPENGYIFRLYRVLAPNEVHVCVFRMFYEPHGNFDASALRTALASTQDPDGRLVDVVLTPPIRVLFAGVYELLRGAPSAVELVQLLRPQMVIPIRNWEGHQSGLLSGLLRGTGSLQEFRESVAQIARRLQLDTQLVRIGEPGEAFTLPLRPLSS